MNPTSTLARCARHVLDYLPALLMVATTAVVSTAQDPHPDPNPAAASGPTVESVRARSAAVSADETLDASVKEQALATFASAIKLLEAAEVSTTAAATFRETVSTAPEQTAEWRRILTAGDNLGVDPLPEAIPDATQEQLDQLLSKVSASAASLRNLQQQLNEQIRTLELRPSTANGELADTRRQLEEADREAPRNATESIVLDEARAAARSAQRRALTARIHLLEQELAAVPVQLERLRAHSDVIAARRALVDQQVTEVQARLQSARERDVRTERTAAERLTEAVADRHPILAVQAEQNATLTRKLSDLVLQASRVTESRTRADTNLTHLVESQAAAREAMTIGAGGREFSAILRQIRSEVPSVTTLERAVTRHKQTILDARLERLRAREQLRGLADIKAARSRLIEEAAEATAGEAAPLPQDAIATLDAILTKRRDLVQQTSHAYERLITEVEELRAAQQELRKRAAALRASLHERLLWLPSAPPLGERGGADVRAGLEWLSQPPEGWSAVLARGGRQALASWPLTLLGVAAFAALVLARRRLRRRLQVIAEQVGRVSTDAHHLTPRAIVITLALAIPGALILVGLGALLVGTNALHLSLPASLQPGIPESTPGVSQPATTFAVCLGHALISAGTLLGFLRACSLMRHSDGVFGAHFGWSARAREVLGKNLRWLVFALVPIAVLVVTTDTSGVDAYRHGLGRLGFIGASIALSIFAYRVLDPRRGAFAELLPRDGLLWRLRGLWFPASYLAPIALGSLAAYGYYDTAALIQQRFFSTGGVLFIGLIGYSVIIRSVVVAHRRIALQRAREARDEARLARAQKDAAEAAGEAMPELEIPKIDLSSISGQTRTLVRTAVGLLVAFALWMVWAEVFPALAVLDEVAAWHRSVSMDGATESVPVPWSAVLGGVLILIITALSYRNLPGLLETVVFPRGNIDRGTRFAITSICRYLLATIGVLIAIDRIGWDWSKAQWIVAAMSVGLGFGLQEIVANFVSGLIILFERPVRVGDTVTVGDLTGTVSRVHIRATTITDWDNLEIIVPNKDLITGRVVNWTLSTPVTRIVLQVGIAYGSDTQKAQAVMLEAAQRCEHVIATPAPTVFFLGFGDSSLNFEVRVFVNDLAHRMPAKHALHTGVDQALKKAGIEIPFPQRDLHVRSGWGGDS